jgi:hypothetical protein
LCYCFPRIFLCLAWKNKTLLQQTHTHKLSLFSFRKGRTRHQNCNQKKTHWRKKKTNNNNNWIFLLILNLKFSTRSGMT